jgi:hypothetical protein
MGAFSDLSIDIQERAENGREEWAVVLDDQNRPAALWRVLGETSGFFLLEHGRTGQQVYQPIENVWLVA